MAGHHRDLLNLQLHRPGVDLEADVGVHLLVLRSKALVARPTPVVVAGDEVLASGYRRDRRQRLGERPTAVHAPASSDGVPAERPMPVAAPRGIPIGLTKVSCIGQPLLGWGSEQVQPEQQVVRPQVVFLGVIAQRIDELGAKPDAARPTALGVGVDREPVPLKNRGRACSRRLPTRLLT